MKKIVLLSTLLFLSVGVSAQTFSKGDKRMDLTVGVGSVVYADKPRATFDQHFGMEWGIVNIADMFTIGLGFQVNNIYGGKYEGTIAGEYNYKYTYYTNGKVWDYSKDKWKSINETEQRTRKGKGVADADIAREDVNALATASFHYSPISKLDVYAKVGVGVGCMNYLTGNYRNEDGFHKADHDEEYSSSIVQRHTVFKYNDLDHVKWYGMKTKVVPAFSSFVGATYYITDNWGVDAQFGMISANIGTYPSSFGIFAVGASYKF